MAAPPKDARTVLKFANDHAHWSIDLADTKANVIMAAGAILAGLLINHSVPPSGGIRRVRKAAREQLGRMAAQPQQAVSFGLDFFTVVEDIGPVAGRLGQPRRQPGLYRPPGLHVTAATAVQHAGFAARWDVAGDRHGVDVPGQDDPLRPAEIGPRHHGVAVPPHAQMR